jgi:acyl dehydratase
VLTMRSEVVKQDGATVMDVQQRGLLRRRPA